MFALAEFILKANPLFGVGLLTLPPIIFFKSITPHAKAWVLDRY
ncbi:hypothetical protein HPELS_02105 [Helicobacter pylori ELS37]|uniref:Uncharacterized protein n=1 Tax=Helicobacter pylori ELS37 TaxID=1055527 RepID=A0ABC7ZEN4_HELPX|nr:hypothetical protein HPELS_02105 [Helicobacter pylori ELS37]